MTGYARKFDENATMSFRANNKQLLKNYNKIWEKVEKLMRIDFESKPVYGDDDKCIKTKIKIYAVSKVNPRKFTKRTKQMKEPARYRDISDMFKAGRQGKGITRQLLK